MTHPPDKDFKIVESQKDVHKLMSISNEDKIYNFHWQLLSPSHANHSVSLYNVNNFSSSYKVVISNL